MKKIANCSCNKNNVRRKSSREKSSFYVAENLLFAKLCTVSTFCCRNGEFISILCTICSDSFISASVVCQQLQQQCLQHPYSQQTLTRKTEFIATINMSYCCYAESEILSPTLSFMLIHLQLNRQSVGGIHQFSTNSTYPIVAVLAIMRLESY